MSDSRTPAGRRELMRHADFFRLWLVGFKELDRNVSLSGVGKTNDDVSEFLRRLSVSRYFTDVRLVKTEEKADKDGSGTAIATQTTISFEMRAKVRY